MFCTRLHLRLPIFFVVCFVLAFIFTLHLYPLISTTEGGPQSKDQLNNFRNVSTTDKEPEAADEEELHEMPPQDFVRFLRLSDDIFLTSAILDLRDSNMDFPCVRIIAIVRSRRPVMCLFSDGTSVEAKFYEHSENHALLYGVFMLNCKIPEQIVPNTVKSFVIQQDETKISVKVQYFVSEKVPDPMPLQYGICLPVLFGNSYTAAHLVQFMEFNKLFGAHHVFVYLQHDALSAEMRKAVDYYTNKRLLTTIEFRLPFKESKIYYHGQLLANQDCLYRNMGLTKYIAFQDIDELLVPYSSEDMVSMLNSVFVGNEWLAGLCLRGSNFATTYQDIAQPPLAIRVTVAFLKSDLPSKCVVRPEMVFEQGVHFTKRVIQQHYQTLSLPRSLGQLHHYRLSKSLRVYDRVTKTFGKKFLTRYQYVIGKVHMK